MAWTGDIQHDKHLAETPYFRHYTYRFMCKKLGHGSNYGGQPTTLATQSHLPIPVVEAFQPVYFNAFPAHQLWQSHVADTLRNKGFLINLTGRKRYFFGRRSSPDTLREAIAYDPQGSLADIVNRSMLRLWHAGLAPIVQHEHDALTFMYPEALEADLIPKLQEMLITPIQLAGGRELRIPWDAQVGWNKGKFNEQDNPNGLVDWKGHDDRKRTPEASVVDRILHRAHRRA
jgi:DNA polymerase I-like protein with 3'-5' exonuclease and polymerase domains